uniref:Uncharacterized protein n=1 Tax=Oryza brachyantha TaxID=4533 RepID=J3MD79_ORYBR
MSDALPQQQLLLNFLMVWSGQICASILGLYIGGAACAWKFAVKICNYIQILNSPFCLITNLWFSIGWFDLQTVRPGSQL